MAKTENAIWVVAQLENGETLGVTYELLGQARRLADTVGQNTAVILIARENNGHAEKRCDLRWGNVKPSLFP